MAASRSVSTRLYDPPSLAIVVIRYFDSVFFSLTNQPGAWGAYDSVLPNNPRLYTVAALSEVRGLAVQLNLHRESCYTGLSESSPYGQC